MPRKFAATSSPPRADSAIRAIAHTSIGGHTGRIRLSNVLGGIMVTVGAAHLALRRGSSCFENNEGAGRLSFLALSF